MDAVNSSVDISTFAYRGRLAPSPTGYLHLGHARTFWTAFSRCIERKGTLTLRSEDLDHSRVKPEFITAMQEDLRWLGIDWQEGPDLGGCFAPYIQSLRTEWYRQVVNSLIAKGVVYCCCCSRQDILKAAAAPHFEDEGPLYPGTCRDRGLPFQESYSLRFRVPESEVIEFNDGRMGPQRWVAEVDFGDFVLRRGDGVFSYQLAATADDHAMQITEVVRGADLLRSTARQILIYRALGWTTPLFYHCPLVLDDQGRRLAKRQDRFSIRQLRSEGLTPEEIRNLCLV